MMTLLLVPHTPAAIALADQVYRLVLAREGAGRHRQRRGTGEASLQRAVGAIVGAVLQRWAKGRLSSRSVSAASFTGMPVTYRAFTSARGAMIELGLLGYEGGKRFVLGEDFNDAAMWGGRVSRFWPTAALLDLAHRHGVAAADVRDTFRRDVPRVPPSVPKLVELRGFGRRQRMQKVRGESLPIDPADAHAAALEADVRAQNAFAATQVVEGCTPPRWYRIFTGDWRLGGRWYAVGDDHASVYLTMPEAERLEDLRIGGERVAEVDVSSAHLSILHARHGLPLPEGDLYARVTGMTNVTDELRKAIKQWFTVALGRGEAKPTWHLGAGEGTRRHDARAICAAMVATYPFLRDLPAAVPAELRKAYGVRSELVALYLQAVEAEAISGALRYLRVHGVLGLPTHDGLIVARSAVGHAKAALEGAFARYAGVRPRLDVSPMTD
jgi:hypothetical protein